MDYLEIYKSAWGCIGKGANWKTLSYPFALPTSEPLCTSLVLENSFCQKGRWFRLGSKFNCGLMMAQIPVSVPKYGLKSEHSPDFVWPSNLALWNGKNIRCIMVLKGTWNFPSTRDGVNFGHISVLMTLIWPLAASNLRTWNPLMTLSHGKSENWIYPWTRLVIWKFSWKLKAKKL